MTHHPHSSAAVAALGAGAVGDLALNGMHDPRLRPRLLRLLLSECLPLPDPDADLEPARRPADLAYALHAVRAHGLLAERAPDQGLLEEWRAAVDAWVDRLLALLRSDREHSCWVGTSFLGVTFQECCDERFAKSYSDWFGDVLTQLKAPSTTKMVNMATCTTMADLFVRLAKFANLEDETTSFAKRVVQPSLELLDENGPVAEKAIDLLGLIMKLFPSSVYRHFNKVESVITGKIASAQCNLQLSKLASTLALLPCVRVSQSSLSLMILRILIVVNGLLDETFLGLEEGNTGQEIMTLLIPPGSKPPPALGGQTTYRDGQTHSTKKNRASAVPTISAFIHCCSVMLTSSYPVQVNIPVRALVTLIQRVLLVDISLHKSLFQSNNLLVQELIFSEIPTLHLIFLDLLGATIKGMRSSLLPNAGSIVMLIGEFFKRAKLPATRTKLYNIVRLLLSSIGVGMAMHLLQVVVSNTFSDLDGNSESNLFFLSAHPIGATNWSSSQSSSRSNQASPRSSVVVNSEHTYSRKSGAPLSVKMAALETLEVLLNVGGTFSAYYWRTEIDLLLINVARDSFYKAGIYDQTLPSTDDLSVPDFQLTALKTLLASFLSCPHERPPYLAQGVKLFKRGKLEIGTKMAKFCLHALRVLDVLVYPQELRLQYVSERVFPLERASHGGLGSRSGAREKSVLDSRRSELSCSVRKRPATDNLGDEVSGWLLSTEDDPTSALVKDTSVEKHDAVGLPKYHVVDTIIGKHSENVSCHLPGPVLEVATPIRTDRKMAVGGTKERDGSCNHAAAFNKLCNPTGSFSVDSAPINTTQPDLRNPVDDSISNEEGGDQGGIASGDASTSPIFPAASVSGSEWDSLEPLFDTGGFVLGSAFSPDKADHDHDSV